MERIYALEINPPPQPGRTAGRKGAVMSKTASKEKPKKKLSAWNRHVAAVMKKGGSMEDASKSWKRTHAPAPAPASRPAASSKSRSAAAARGKGRYQAAGKPRKKNPPESVTRAIESGKRYAKQGFSLVKTGMGIGGAAGGAAAAVLLPMLAGSHDEGWLGVLLSGLVTGGLVGAAFLLPASVVPLAVGGAIGSGAVTVVRALVVGSERVFNWIVDMILGWGDGAKPAAPPHTTAQTTSQPAAATAPGTQAGFRRGEAAPAPRQLPAPAARRGPQAGFDTSGARQARPAYANTGRITSKTY
jgi:hypothetical protein